MQIENEKCQEKRISHNSKTPKQRKKALDSLKIDKKMEMIANSV